MSSLSTTHALIRYVKRLVPLAAVMFAGSVYAAGMDVDLNTYKIEPEDVLEIHVWKEEELQKEVVVRPDGGVSFPLVGTVHAAGKTTSELESALVKQLSEYIRDVVVTVAVKELNGLRIYVNGKVKNPGEYELGRYVDVLQALSLAGGLTPFADGNDIRILRREEGREVMFRFNYGQVQKGRKLEQNIVLQPNDIVLVP